MPPRLAFDDVKRIFEAAKCTLVSKEYKTNKKPLEYLCSCGNTEVQKTRLDSFNLGIRCKYCREERLKATNMERYGYEYVSQRPETKESALKGLRKHVEEKKHTIEELRDIYKKEGCELLESTYKDNTIRMRFKCICGNEGKTTFNKFNKGQRCSYKTCINKRKDQTNVSKFGVTNYAKTEECKTRRKATCMKNFGVEHAMQSADIQDKAEKTGYSYKIYTFPSGKQFNIQGYENYILDYVLLSFDEDDILVGRKQQPEIWYTDAKGTKHRYFSDIYILSEKLIIEVKSTWTYKKGIKDGKIPLQKASCIQQGYNYTCFIVGENGILETPDD
jgi:hypothetical protein